MKRTTRGVIGSAIVLLGCFVISGCSTTTNTRQKEAPGIRDIPANAFAQDDIVIVPPLKHAQIQGGADDGGTIRATLTDARNDVFVIYVDHRVDSTTKGDVYLNTYPTNRLSVHVRNQQEFRDKIGSFDKGPGGSF